MTAQSSMQIAARALNVDGGLGGLAGIAAWYGKPVEADIPPVQAAHGRGGSSTRCRGRYALTMPGRPVPAGYTRSSTTGFG